MAVLSREYDGADYDGELDIFAANGDPVRSITLPRAIKRYVSMAYEGPRAVVVGYDELLIVDCKDGKSERYKLEPHGDEQRGWDAFISPSTGDLLLYAGDPFGADGSKIYRYELPPTQKAGQP
jgi:hypothetical protein